MSGGHGGHGDDNLKGLLYDKRRYNDLPTLLAEYEDKVFTPEAQENALRTMNHGWMEAYNFLVDNLGQIERSEDGRPKYTSFRQAREAKKISDKEARARTEHLAYGLSKRHKAIVHSKSPDEMERHIDELYSEVGDEKKREDLQKYFMDEVLTDQFKQKYNIQSFDQVVELLENHPDIIGAIASTDPENAQNTFVKELLESYKVTLNPTTMHRRHYKELIADAAIKDYDTFRGLMNSKLHDYNIQLKNLPGRAGVLAAVSHTLDRLLSPNAEAELKSPEHRQHISKDGHLEYVEEPKAKVYHPKFGHANHGHGEHEHAA